MSKRTTLADSLHQAGRWDESAALFREAEAMQAERQPEYPRLYSLWGYRYCDLLLGQAEPDDGSYRKACEEVRERADEALQIVLRGSKSLLAIALNNLSLGRAHLGLALTSGTSPGSPQGDFTEAAKHLDRAVDGLRQSGNEDDFPRGLLARAALRRLRDDADAAAADLRDAEDIAVRGNMRLHEADVHLEWTRLRRQMGRLEDARRHLERARDVVTATGYGRREREVTYLGGRLGSK